MIKRLWPLLLLSLLACVYPKNPTVNTTGIPVLMYHHVVSGAEKAEFFPDNANVMAASQLSEQMQYLHDQGYTTLTMDELHCYLIGECNVPAKSVVITIDDGNVSTHKYILPVLKRHHFNATAFMITSRIADVTPPWTPDPRVFMGWDLINGVRKSYPHLEFHSHSHDQHHEVDDVKAVHTMTYEQLLADVQQASVTLGSDVYAYPFGNHNELVVQALQDAGYRMAFITQPGRVIPHMDHLHLPRYAVNAKTTMTQFKAFLGE